MDAMVFVPHPLFRGGHLQTIAGQLGPPPPEPAPAHRLAVPVSDGDALVLDVDEAPGLAPEAPTVVLLHGLGGTSRSTYNLRLSARLTPLGVRVVRFNHRGMAELAGVPPARGIYHAGRRDDILAALMATAARWPRAELATIGFSLSGNALLALLGEQGATLARSVPSLAAAAAVCAPIDLEACSQALSRPVNWPIDRYYTRSMRRLVADRTRRGLEEGQPPLPAKLNLRLFDEVYTAPRGGFASRDDYYARSSAARVVGDIAVPTLFFAAADDPLVPPESWRGARFSKKVQVYGVRSGGHMGFIARKGERRFMDAAIVEWLRQVFRGWK
jgi:predicted alpha/beta-fold hydrolase